MCTNKGTRKTCLAIPTVVSASSVCAQFIGAMYVYSASGKAITRRRVYFEASDPKQPFMRVSDSDDTDVTVATTYGWDRSKHARSHALNH